jgi:hypothetical protein
MTADDVTLKLAPAFAEAGLDTETLLTLTSEVASTFVFALFEPLLLPELGSVTCNWSTTVDADTEKL